VRVLKTASHPKNCNFYVIRCYLISDQFEDPYNKCSFHYPEHSFTLDSQSRKMSAEVVTVVIRNRNAARRVMYLMSSIYFAPGTARESEVSV